MEARVRAVLDHCDATGGATLERFLSEVRDRYPNRPIPVLLEALKKAKA